MVCDWSWCMSLIAIVNVVSCLACGCVIVVVVVVVICADASRRLRSNRGQNCFVWARERAPFRLFFDYSFNRPRTLPTDWPKHNLHVSAHRHGRCQAVRFIPLTWHDYAGLGVWVLLSVAKMNVHLHWQLATSCAHMFHQVQPSSINCVLYFWFTLPVWAKWIDPLGRHCMDQWTY